MISGEKKLIYSLKIRLILEQKFGDDPLYYGWAFLLYIILSKGLQMLIK